jgi:hypothetical protein
MPDTKVMDPQLLDRIWEKAVAVAAKRRQFPEATYRLQLHLPAKL